MAQADRYRMSAERLEELKKELKYIEDVREREVAELIKEARSFGDLSENSEYDEAKTQQGKLYSRKAEVEDLIENAIIIVEDEADKDLVSIGSTVTIAEEGTDEDETYKIVGSQEANPMLGTISDVSKIGSAVLGHRVGDTVSYEANGMTLRFVIKGLQK